MIHINKKILIALATLLALSQAGLLLFVLNIKPAADKHELRSFLLSPEFYDQAYEQAGAGFERSTKQVYGGIIPHHLMVKDKIAGFFKSLENEDYDYVVIIGPDHLDDGRGDIITSPAIWNTPYGQLMPAEKVIDKLLAVEEPRIVIDDFAMGQEHSISGLVPFVKKNWPQAKLAPIILASDVETADLDLLIELLIKYLPAKRTLILASVDFSHLQNAVMADLHDAKSRAVIENFQLSSIDELEIDSPASIYVVMKYLDQLGARRAELLSRTSASRLNQQLDEPTTTHQIYRFTRGPALDYPAANYLFFGDIMLDRGVKQTINERGVDYLFEKLVDQEKRFFQGIDIISANLEGAVTENQAHYEPERLFDFAFEPEDVGALKNYGFNYFSLANNHVFDQGEPGFQETAAYLTANNIHFSGCGDYQVQECSWTIIDVNGQRVGLVGLSSIYRDLPEAAAAELLDQLAEKTDFIAVNIHWGGEYELQFNIKQQTLAHSLIDHGADLIIGHHPHVVQGVEIYQGQPIFYSLGNFIFDQQFSAAVQHGLAVGVAQIDNQIRYYLLPYKLDNFQPRLLTESEKPVFFKQWIENSAVDSAVIEQIMAAGVFEL